MNPKGSSGRWMQLTEKRSVLPPGKALQAAIYRLFPSVPPHILDGYELWRVGAMLGTDMQEPSPEEQAEAEAIMEARKQAVLDRQARLKEEKQNG